MIMCLNFVISFVYKFSYSRILYKLYIEETAKCH
jgi:hypothetical protein